MPKTPVPPKQKKIPGTAGGKAGMGYYKAVRLPTKVGKKKPI